MTEHAAVIFVFFFLAEYASIVFMCVLISILYVGGYNTSQTLLNYSSSIDLVALVDFVRIFTYTLINAISSAIVSNFYSLINFSIIDINAEIIPISSMGLTNIYPNINMTPESSSSPFMLAIKTALFVFIFIWVRASFPRIRFDQLMSFCWTVLLPLVFAFIIVLPCLTYANGMFPVNILF